MTIHRLQRHGDRSYGKARTLCGLDVQGQIHPLAEVYTDRADLELDLSEGKCTACEASYSGAVAESRARAGYRTVHFLDHGLPLCGYGEGKPPGDWPADQAWLALTEYKSYRPPREIDVQICKGCKAKFEAWHAAHPARCGCSKIVSPTREVRCELKAGHPQPCSFPVENALDHMRAPKTPAQVMTDAQPGDVEGARAFYGGSKCTPHGIGDCAVCWRYMGRPTMRGAKNPDDGMRRFEVWSLRTIGNGGIDVRVGRAIENRDGSLVLELPDLGVKLRLKPTI